MTKEELCASQVYLAGLLEPIGVCGKPEADHCDPRCCHDCAGCRMARWHRIEHDFVKEKAR